MSEFVPTTLCVKQHKITKLKYFCKTTKSNFVSYKGSGVYWKNHLKQHSNEVETIWHKTFYDKDDLVEFALFFSEFFDIVHSKNSSGKKIWANEILENGLDGWTRGQKRKSQTEKQKKEHSQRMSGKNNPMFEKLHTDDTKKKIKLKATGRKHKEETLVKFSEDRRGNKNANYNNRGAQNPLFNKKREEHSKRMAGANNPFYNKTHSDETLKKLRVPKPLISCILCKKVVGGSANLKRWHEECE